MDNHDLEVARLARTIQDASPYSDLWLDERFQIWKREQVDKKLEALRLTILKAAPVATSEDQQQIAASIMGYRMLVEVFEDVFKRLQKNEERARIKLQELNQIGDNNE